MMPVTLAVDFVRVMDQEMNERHREAARRRLFETESSHERSNDRHRHNDQRRSPFSALISAIRLNGA